MTTCQTWFHAMNLVIKVRPLLLAILPFYGETFVVGVGAQPPQLGQRDGDQPRWDGELPRQEEGEAETIE